MTAFIKSIFLFTLLILTNLLSGKMLYAQDESEFSLSIEIRPRAEFRNGAFTLRNPGDEPAFFVSQRSRLALNYQKNKLSLGFGAQNIRVWGASPQIATNEGNNTMFHEAWAAYQLNDELSFKVGRQSLVYDDDRILGSLDWHQAGRWHDVALLRYEPENWKVHLGAAYNQDTEKLRSNFYSSPGNHYKTLQMAWLGHQINKQAKLSILVLNTGFQQQQDSSQNFLQTIGGNFYLLNSILDLTTSFYYQMGENKTGTDVNAYLASIYGDVELNNKYTFLFGTDYLSGENMKDGGDNKTTSFDPLYGTHHKFYGYMDYFYVGNPHQNVGLWDKYLGILTKVTNNFSLQLRAHHFDSGGADVIPSNDTEPVETYLGTELDLTYNWLIAPAVRLMGGYSQMLASKSMEVLKGGDHEAFQNWVWMMLTVNPRLF